MHYLCSSSLSNHRHPCQSGTTEQVCLPGRWETQFFPFHKLATVHFSLFFAFYHCFFKTDDIFLLWNGKFRIQFTSRRFFFTERIFRLQCEPVERAWRSSITAAGPASNLLNTCLVYCMHLKHTTDAGGVKAPHLTCLSQRQSPRLWSYCSPLTNI